MSLLLLCLFRFELFLGKDGFDEEVFHLKFGFFDLLLSGQKLATGGFVTICLVDLLEAHAQSHLVWLVLIRCWM